MLFICSNIYDIILCYLMKKVEEVFRLFFHYKDQIPSDQVFHGLDISHIIALLVIALVVTLLLRYMKRMPKKQADHIIQIAAIVLPLVELIRVLWLIMVGQTDWVRLLPLQLCGTQIFYIPLAVFTKNMAIKEFTCSTALLGGIVALLCPSGIAGYYPLLHFQTLQSFTLHAILLFVPLAMMYVQGFRPNIKNMPNVMGILVLTASVAGVVDACFNVNYMCLRTPPEGTPLVDIYNACGYGFYLFVLAAAMTLAVFLTYLPHMRKNKKEKQKVSAQQISS